MSTSQEVGLVKQIEREATISKEKCDRQKPESGEMHSNCQHWQADLEVEKTEIMQKHTGTDHQSTVIPKHMVAVQFQFVGKSKHVHNNKTKAKQKRHGLGEQIRALKEGYVLRVLLSENKNPREKGRKKVERARGEPKKAKSDESVERKEHNSDRVEGDACEGVDTEEPGAEKTTQRARQNDDRGKHNKIAGAKKMHKREVLDQPGGGWQCLGVREIKTQKKTTRRFPTLKGKRENNEKRTEKIRRSVKKKKRNQGSMSPQNGAKLQPGKRGNQPSIPISKTTPSPRQRGRTRSTRRMREDRSRGDETG